MSDDHDLAGRSDALLLRGQTAEAIALLTAQPPASRSSRLWLALGDAYRAGQQLDAALAAYQQADPHGIDTDHLNPAIGWRVGLIHQTRGAAESALATYRRVPPDRATGPVEAWLLAGAATAHWRLGNVDEALTQAAAAVERAAATDLNRIRAEAYVAIALARSLGGDPARVEEEYAVAARFADAAGDLVQLARIQLNRSHHLLADARFAEAVHAAAAAGAAAQSLGSPTLFAVALGNESESLVRLGRFSDAQDRCEQAIGLAGEIGTERIAGALVVLAVVHLRRGCREQGRAALEQALRLTTDRQVRVPALASLAVAYLPENPEVASSSAANALAEACGSSVLPALIPAGRAHWAQGNAASARTLAARAVEHARQQRERCWLAEALELRALTVEGSGDILGISRYSGRDAHLQVGDTAGIADVKVWPRPARSRRV